MEKLSPDRVRSLVKEYLSKKGLPEDIALTFKDVTIVGGRKSEVFSRDDLIDETRSRLAGDIWLNVPIVSANMIDVTESRMAIAMARDGGLGFIHQFLTTGKKEQEIRKVKRADSGVIENPLSIGPEATLGEALELMRQYQVSGGLLVVEPVDDLDDVLVGILTSRDIRLETDKNKKVSELMTKQPLITAPRGTTLEQARETFRKNKNIEKLPLVDEKGGVLGLITTKDILKREQFFPHALRDKKGRLMVGAAIGVSGNFIAEAERLIKAGADIILADAPNGFSVLLENAVKSFKTAFGSEVPIVAGNVDEPEGCLMLIEAGADCVKVGIGPGGSCTTREDTGAGIPQITAVAQCVAVASHYNIPVISDGGIRKGADFSKALVAGASAVMLGTLLAGCEETPGEILPFTIGGQRYKINRGSASIEAQATRPDRLEGRIRAPEGTAPKVPVKGSVSEIIDELMFDLRSSITLRGSGGLEEHIRDRRFLRQTGAGDEEGKPL